jgi:3-oxoacyl-[acyl-carrier protein] reductase
MIAIVTGGNRGIGLEITKGLLEKGFEVHVLSRSGIDISDKNIVSWKVDVSDYTQTVAIADKIGVPEVLVNNAGMMNSKIARDCDHDDILKILNLNLISAVRLSLYLAEKMANGSGGRIVSIGSLAGAIGHPDIWYGVSKAGIANAMRSLSRAFGPRGVVANSVAPGPVETEMMQSIPQDRKDRVKAATINQRFCFAEEVAKVVCWLATDAPSYINGEIIDINNGVNYR